MKKLTTKKIVLWGGAVMFICSMIILFANDYGGFSCRYYTADGHAVKYCETAFFVLLPMVATFLLSLITYKMRDEVFRAWWNFARWWVPVIILVTYLQSTQSGGGGLGIGGAISSGFDILVLSFFYAVLVIVSLWLIVKKYRQLKREGK